MQKFVISWFPYRKLLFVHVDYGQHFTQGGDTIFVKTHEPYDPDGMYCDCGGSWNARNEHGTAVHFCNREDVMTMYKKTRLVNE